MDAMRCSAGPRIALPQDLLQDDDSFITRYEPGAKPSLMSNELPTQGRVARIWGKSPRNSALAMTLGGVLTLGFRSWR
jgi:hypothetical protein